MIADINLFNLLVPVLIVTAVAGQGFVVDGQYMASWARWFNIELTDGVDPIARRYLVWTRRCRTAGGVIGALAPTFLFEIIRRGQQPPDDIGGWAGSMMLVGYLIGALVAELVMDPRRKRSRKTAGVHARLGDILPTYAVTLQRGLAIASPFLAAVYAFARPKSHISGLPDVAQVAALGVAALVIAAVVEAFQRRILARPVATEVDNAMRASSVRVLSGGAIALLLGIAGPIFLLSAVSLTSDAGPSVGLAFVAFGLLFLTSMHFWLHFGKPGGFGNRQRERQGATT
jgi:hypothetical protein